MSRVKNITFYIVKKIVKPHLQHLINRGKVEEAEKIYETIIRPSGVWAGRYLKEPDYKTIFISTMKQLPAIDFLKEPWFKATKLIWGRVENMGGKIFWTLTVVESVRSTSFFRKKSTKEVKWGLIPAVLLDDYAEESYYITDSQNFAANDKLHKFPNPSLALDALKEAMVFERAKRERQIRSRKTIIIDIFPETSAEDFAL